MVVAVVMERPDPAHGNQVVNDPDSMDAPFERPVLTVVKGEATIGSPEWERLHLNVTKFS